VIDRSRGTSLLSLWVLALLVLTLTTAQTPAPPPPASETAPADLSGTIEIKGTDDKALPAEGAVVWIAGQKEGASPPAPTLSSRDKRFDPHVIAVPVGTTLNFPNYDRIYHNVFSRSTGNDFDLGLYRKGASRTMTFKKPGLVRVYCNIHPEMAAVVMVLDTSAFAVTGADGRYHLPGLPPGRHSLHVWDERGGEQQLVVDLAPGSKRTLNSVLDASGYRRTAHKNKFDKDYPPVTKDVDRY
jgi:plastocyanin